MIEGSRTYYLPLSEIEVEVFFEHDGGSVYFSYAEIGGEELNCDMLGVHVDITQPSDTVRKTEYIPLREYFQRRLTDNICEIQDAIGVVGRTDYEEHYPAGVL